MSKVLWIDQKVDNYINIGYAKELRAINSVKYLKLFKNTEEAITYLKEIRFDETIIIVSGRLYAELVEKFKESLLEILKDRNLLNLNVNVSLLMDNLILKIVKED